MRTVVIGGPRERRPPSLQELLLRLVVNAVGLWLNASHEDRKSVV